VNIIRTSFALRTFAALAAFFAWVVLSNHCALAALLAKLESPAAAAEPSCCKNQPKPADGNGQCPQLPQGCCAKLKIAMPDAAKVPQAVVAAFVPIFAEVLAVIAYTHDAESTAAPATGPPPDVPAFAELVLNRSLLSHAPPALA
jgi:hypothetical protein